MGYYVETPSNRGKAVYLMREHGGEVVKQPTSYADIPAGKGCICIVDNVMLEAAGFIYSAHEFEAFTEPNDRRPRTFILIDRDVAERLSGFSPAVSKAAE